MATYNGEKYIKEQLDSILPQLSHNDEVIISDDCSVDRTIEIIKLYDDKRITLFINNIKLGVTSNFSNSMSKANGDIIFLSDQDDVWLENKVASCLTSLKRFDLVVTNCKVVNDKLDVTCESYFDLVRSGKGFSKNIFKSTYLGCCLAFKRELLNDILPIPRNLLMYHDWWIGFVAERKYSVFFENEPLLLFRRHGATTSTTVSSSKNTIFFKVFSRVQLLVLGLVRLRR
jgi:glycosyltransferase involved in cell wall biosynthesis